MMGRIPCIGLMVAVLLVSAPASADRVITIGDVANRVKVRHRPTLDSPSIGSLPSDQSAQLIDSMPYWYHIQLDNGVPGYVSRAWTRKLSEAEGDGEILRLGFWNLESAASNSSKDYQMIARIIESTFDAVGITGLASSAPGQSEYDLLLQALGAGWAGVAAKSSADATTGQTAVYYRVALARPSGGSTEMQVFGNSPESQTEALTGTVAFAFLEAPMNKATMGVDFAFGVYAGADGDLKSIDKAIEAVRAARPTERDVIIAGSFNMAAPDLQNAVQARVLTRGEGSVLTPDGELTKDLHDHMLIAEKDLTVESIDAPHVVDVRGAAASNQEFYDRGGRRLPLVLRLRTTGPDDD